ncbi:hypothetical protein F4815DRAFT_448766 [Daldinia loculata]|nr:hypothetical protein F4815DRAFT_448766 [Daldinia loculata]
MSKNAYLQANDKVSVQLLSKAPEGQVYDSSCATKGRKDDAAILVLKDDENLMNFPARDEVEAIDKKSVLKKRI